MITEILFLPYFKPTDCNLTGPCSIDMVQPISSRHFWSISMTKHELDVDFSNELTLLFLFLTSFSSRCNFILDCLCQTTKQQTTKVRDREFTMQESTVDCSRSAMVTLHSLPSLAVKSCMPTLYVWGHGKKKANSRLPIFVHQCIPGPSSDQCYSNPIQLTQTCY